MPRTYYHQRGAATCETRSTDDEGRYDETGWNAGKVVRTVGAPTDGFG
jgi:hypothetical protein